MELFGLFGNITLDGNPAAFALSWPVIPDRTMHTASVVPECHIVQRPAKPNLIIDLLGMVPQVIEDCIAFGL